METLMERPIRRAIGKRKPEPDATLGQVVEVIVHHFKGDTGAFFESLNIKQPPHSDVDSDTQLVRRFTKSF